MSGGRLGGMAASLFVRGDRFAAFVHGFILTGIVGLHIVRSGELAKLERLVGFLEKRNRFDLARQGHLIEVLAAAVVLGNGKGAALLGDRRGTALPKAFLAEFVVRGNRAARGFLTAGEARLNCWAVLIRSGRLCVGKVH